MKAYVFHKKGVTLVEILVAAFLLVLVGLVCWALFRSSIDASTSGYTNIKIQENARNALRTLETELRQAVKPPKIGNIPQYTSGVLYPCTDQPDTEHTNRLLFLEVIGMDNPSTSFTQNLQFFRGIEYRVLPGDSLKGEKLVRRVWDSVQAPLSATFIRGLNWNAANGYSFTITAYDGATGYTDEVLLELPFPNDRMHLALIHPRVENSALYDNKIYRINYTLEQTVNNNIHRKKDFSLTTTVKIQ